jgi:hypothetical protein
MTTMQARGFRRQMMGKLREYEGQLLRLEGQLLILRAKAQRVTGEAQARLGHVLEEMDRELETVQGAGRAALEGLGRAAELGGALLDRLKDDLQGLEGLAPSAVAKSRVVAKRATIEAKALRHGVKVGLRVARRASRRAKAAKS